MLGEQMPMENKKGKKAPLHDFGNGKQGFSALYDVFQFTFLLY